MSSSTEHDRPEQIELLTAKVARLPLDPISSHLMDIVVEHVEAAWRRISAKDPTLLARSQESEVNSLMTIALNHRIEECPLLKSVVKTAARDSAHLNYSGRKINKAPDIALALTDPRRGGNFPLLIECKVINKAQQKTINAYCTNGVARFVVGDYAWYASEALMLAYVVDNVRPAVDLSKAFGKGASQGTAAYGTVNKPAARRIPGRRTTSRLACSRHSRAFVYLPCCAPWSLPGTIALWHLWVRC